MTTTVGAPSTVEYETLVLRNVIVPMRDGKRLATDVYLPATEGKPASGRFPAILERTPYLKESAGSVKTGRFFAARGYVCIFQDLRGRGGSEGEWAHFFNGENEVEDGFDTAQWLRSQAWSNGEFGTIGVSYVGAMQQALAIGNPPGLKAQFLTDCGFNYHTHGQRSHGAFFLALYMPFFFRMAKEDISVRGNAEAQRELGQALAEMPQWLRRLPLKRGESPLHFVPKYEELLLKLASHGKYDKWWQTPPASMEAHLERYPDVPLYLLTSWYGYHVWANGQKFNRLGARFKSPLHLTIGTWLHGFETLEESTSGGVEFGSAAVANNANDARLRWFDRFLKGVGPGMVGERKVEIFVMGGGSGRRNAAGRIEHGGRWIRATRWPLPGATQRELFLHTDGNLSEKRPVQTAEPRQYVFDPNDPVPSIGGSGSPGNVLFPTGGWEQRENPKLNPFCTTERPLAERADVLVYASAPLEYALTVVGPVTVKLWVSSSARDTDFTAKLLDVYPDGTALNLCDGIVRMRFRNSGAEAELLEPGKVYEVSLDLQGTGNVFAAGHQIRVDVSSSNFPQFDVNPNTGKGLWQDAERVAAKQRIWCDVTRPSHLVLPVVEP